MKKKEELNKSQNPYKTDKLAKVPSWLKILLLKFWVAAATFFFFGVANELIDATSGNAADLYFVFISFGMGLMNEFITKNLVRYMKNSMDNTFHYNMVNKKGTLSLFLNIGYGFITVLPIMFISSFLASKGLILNLFGAEGLGGIEPITDGLIYIVVDFIYMVIKNGSINIYKRFKLKKDEAKINKIINNINNENNKEDNNNEN